MSQENTPKAGGGAGPMNGPLPPALSAADLGATLDSLGRQVQQLLQERDSYRQTLEAVRAERDEYRRGVYALLHEYSEKNEPLTGEEIQRRIAEEKWSPLEEFIGDIEKTALGS